MYILLTVHSLLRWAIVVVGAIALVKFLLGWLGRRRFGKMDRGLLAGFSGLMDAQALLGFFYFLVAGLTGGGFPMYRIEHLATMLLAAIAAHAPSRFKRGGSKHFVALAALAVALFLVYIGVARLPGGWSR
jgi:bacteriorhodopsin